MKPTKPFIGANPRVFQASSRGISDEMLVSLLQVTTGIVVDDDSLLLI